jgi:hypothetical protein
MVDPRVAQFRGFLRLGPEQMSFQRCEVPRSTQWWWELAPTAAWEEVDGWKRAKDILDAQPLCDLHTLPCKLQEVYAEFDGDVTPPGRFGHVGA